MSAIDPVDRWRLRLYIAGRTRLAERTLSTIRAVCEEHLAGRYELEVVDLTLSPDAAERAQIIAIPTLVRELPEPLRRLIGDLSDHDKLLRGLELVRSG